MLSLLDAPLGRYELFERDPELQFMEPLARNWELDWPATVGYLRSEGARGKRPVAESFLAGVPEVVGAVERAFARELPGALILMPSYGEFDGFARYELGEHHVMLGIDFPDADVDYLRALTAHELSHVYRDHRPEVWGHLGKPLHHITRAEYLAHGTAAEHLASEGLATLFSQILFPEIPAHVHHYYELDEWQWCVEHDAQIDQAIRRELQGGQDVWSFYSPGSAGSGSPSRTQYYWAAKKLAERLGGLAGDREAQLRAVVELHARPAEMFVEFMHK